MDHVIPLIYDVTQRNWVTSVGGSVVQDPIEIGQMQSITFKVKFVKDGVQYALTTPTFSGGVKALNAVGAGYLLQFSTPTVSGSGATTVYEFELLIDSSQLRAFIASYLPSYLGFSYALEIRESFNNIATLPALSTKIYPDYTIVGTSPTTAVGTWNIAAGQTFTVNKTFAMPLDDGTAGFVLKTNGAGVGSWAADNAGTGTVTSVAQSFTGGIVSVSGLPVTTSGTLALTVAGTAGGIVYFSSNSVWASSGAMGQGSLIVGGASGAPPNPVSAQTAGKVLISNGVITDPIYSSTITLGASGTLGTIAFGNATTSGGILTIAPPTGLYSSATITLPNATTTLAGLAVTQSFTQVNTFSSSTASSSTTSGAVVITGGLGVGGNAYVGGVINIAATTSTAGQITQAGTRILHTYGTAGNFFAGPGAGTLTSSGVGHNCGVGHGSLASLGSSNGYNTGLGSYTLNGVTTGSGNMGIGYGAAGGQNCSNNTAIGYQSLNNNSGGNNTAVGFNTGQTGAEIGGLTPVIITTGSNNTLLGTGAGITLASGTYRTAIGSGSRCQNNNAIKLGRDENDVVILPSMTTTQRNAYATPVGGSLIFNVTTGKLNFWNSTAATPAWEAVTSA